jgi:hypothetical protein
MTNERTPIINVSGDYEETIVQLARHLGRSKLRRKIFNTIYGRARKPRSKKQIMEAAKISSAGTVAQQVQNELDHLSKHHLIVRVANEGAVKDGSRFLYEKDMSVRANKDRIIKFADDRKAAARIPTKRRPFIQQTLPIQKVTRQSLKKRKRLTVLYLTANPDPNSPLRVDAEVRKVQDAVRGSVFRDNITIEYRPSADLTSLVDGLNDHRPQIVHFSGHSSTSGLIVDSGKVGRPTVGALSFELLAKALSATDHPPTVVVLNSCESSVAGRLVLRTSDIVVTMRVPITDIAATAFAQRFYAAIASGQSVRSAFEQGKVAVESVSIGETTTPKLFHRASRKPETIILT